MKNPTPKPAAMGKGGGKQSEPEDNKEGGKKRKKEEEMRDLIKNESPPKEICMLANKTWAINFAKKHVNKQPKWHDKCIMCSRWFLQKILLQQLQTQRCTSIIAEGRGWG
jgi:hypothetical protein